MASTGRGATLKRKETAVRKRKRSAPRRKAATAPYSKEFEDRVLAAREATPAFGPADADDFDRWLTKKK